MKSPLTIAIVYMLLGVIFTFFAIQQVLSSGWGLFAYILIILATLDFGSGLRMLIMFFQMKRRKS